MSSRLNLRRAVRTRPISYLESDWHSDAESEMSDDDPKPASVRGQVRHLSRAGLDSGRSKSDPPQIDVVATGSNVKQLTHRLRARPAKNDQNHLSFRSSKRVKTFHESYREPSSSDELAPSDPPRPPALQQPAGVRAVSNAAHDALNPPSTPISPVKSAKLHQKKPIARRIVTTPRVLEAQQSNDASQDESEDPKARCIAAVERLSVGRSRAQLSDDKKKTEDHAAHQSQPYNSEARTQMQELPYHILLGIMQHASHPLHTNTFHDTGSTKWLLDTSTLCRSLRDACIGALMRDPPIFPSHRAQNIVALLRSCEIHYDKPSTEDEKISTRASQRPPTVDYRRRIQLLTIEVRSILVSKAGIDLKDLVRLTPQLKHLRLVHSYDALANQHIWATPNSDKSGVKWSYDKDGILDVLNQEGIRLETFEWNGRFMRDDPELSSFESHCLHSQCLRNLKTLILRNFLLPDAEKLREYTVELLNNDEVEITATMRKRVLLLITRRRRALKAMNALTGLSTLEIDTCNILDEDTITSLPSNLRHLKLVKVFGLNSEGLARYLTTRGHTLQSLELVGNQELSLGFMAHLAAATPNLQKLAIDLQYHDPSSYHDTEPFYDELLPDGPPTWPSTLQQISIEPLRMPTVDDAVSFYQTLLDASPDLPVLGALKLRTLLKEASWKDRAKLRENWAAKLNGAFSASNNPALPPPSGNDGNCSSSSHGSISSQLAGRKHRRAMLRGQAGNGRCHTIVFEVSDQRPASQQYHEADFLDSEPEGDDEWVA